MSDTLTEGEWTEIGMSFLRAGEFGKARAAFKLGLEHEDFWEEPAFFLLTMDAFVTSAEKEQLAQRFLSSERAQHWEKEIVKATSSPASDGSAIDKLRLLGAAYEKAQNLDALGSVCRLLNKAGCYSDTIALCEGHYRESQSLRVHYARALIMTKNFDAAAEVVRGDSFTKSIRSFDLFDALIDYGERKYGLAASKLGAYAHKHPENFEATFFAAFAYAAVKEDEKAREYVERALAMDPEHGESLVLKGKLLCKSGAWIVGLRTIFAGARRVMSAPSKKCGAS